MNTVSDLLRTKGHAVWSIGPDATVFEALQLMADKDVGALVVLDGGRLAGILSERDYARKVILRGRSSRETPVREIMTERVYTIHPEESVEACMALMTDRRVRHLPVVDGEELLGLISIGDVVKCIISDQEFHIRQLHKYISGER
jgi:CBS domain-containing protein